MTEIDQLKQQAAELSQRIAAAETEVAQAHNQPLVGRCFKFRTRGACYTNCAAWWVYFKVLRLSGSGVTVFSFQRTEDGRYVIEPAKYMPQVSAINVEVSEEEWRQEYAGMVAELGGMNQSGGEKNA